MEKEKDELNQIIEFHLIDFESKVNNIQVTENKLVLLFEYHMKSIIKYNTKKWLFVGIILGMVIVRLLQFLPNG